MRFSHTIKVLNRAARIGNNPAPANRWGEFFYLREGHRRKLFGFTAVSRMRFVHPSYERILRDRRLIAIRRFCESAEDHDGASEELLETRPLPPPNAIRPFELFCIAYGVVLRVCLYVEQHGQIRRRDVMDSCNLSPDQAKRILKDLVDGEQLVQRGVKKGAFYERAP